MLVLLTRILLWATIGLLVWYILTKIIPKAYLTWFGGVVVLVLIVASFADPNDETIGTIWRLISLPLTPLGATILLLGSAMSEGVKKVKGQQVAVALAILLVTSLPIVSRSIVSRSESEVQQAFTDRAAQCGEVCPAGVQGPRLDRTGAIVVLGNDAGDSRESVAFQSASDQAYNSSLVPRLIYAAQLYGEARQAGANPFVVVTADPGGDSEASQAKRQNIRTVLLNNGVPAESIRFESTGLNVQGTANRVDRFLRDQQILAARENRNEPTDARVMLVAPAMTMTRSALTFENMGMQVIAKPTDFYSVNTWSSNDTFSRLPDIIPNVDALQLTSRYWDEVLTSTYYFLRGWLPGFNFGWDPNIEV
ncbi:YdcF family protein [Leptolyngbya cf. ectocarpi LEGE 11479]|uniref:YdcF family protein n=1 Tax=Leptolyngbya cf. ectocarpi LEGE 11479 TaxID=1828722 RepID=A0A928ZVC2_LEPEC|nr:YdcF family protein [Leptolyngbya ectocarpi]MBE9068040.1 YdcF family protein [Leptolyngbya cf. ectocarpi LEGE 11479]